MSKGLKLAGLIVGVSLIDVIVLTPGLIGIEISISSAIRMALDVSIITASVLILLYGIHQIFFSSNDVKPIKVLKTSEDYVHALNRYQDSKVLKNDISFTLVQVDRMKKKKETLLTMLNDRFDPNELSYQKFTSVIIEVEKLFYLNLKNILNKISTFDESEYKNIINKEPTRFSTQLLQEKTNLYNEYVSFVKDSVNLNEGILLNLDKLLLEISRLDSFEIEEIEKMACMQEMDALIKQTKYYKH
ncbi:hypothetical protein [Bacillus sp. EAC]|uniref:hypothetical protein n=1 Tax=Bacillus sp. EAC TaxID=1978338 RepID=UPI00211ACA8D|nr:hypothetical protein [Bacillus sp. EAC]